MTREELLSQMKARRMTAEVITWAQFAAAVSGLSQANKNSLMALLNAGKAADAGSLLVGIVTTMRRDQAYAYVAAMAADDTWTTDELLELLGG